MSTPSIGDFLGSADTWPKVKPRGWEYEKLIGLLEMLGNDQWGDCGEAGIAHFIQTETANSGNPLHMTLAQVLALYTAVAGFDPNAGPPGQNPTDQGTFLINLLNYAIENGIQCTDSKGNIVLWKLLGYASVDLSSIAQMRYLLDLFGGLYLGIQCPQNALSNTNNWTYDPKSPIENGHCINATGQGGAGGHIQSWGLNIPFTWEFMLKNIDEGYVLFSDYWLEKSGTSPSGYSKEVLLNVFSNLKANVKHTGVIS